MNTKVNKVVKKIIGGGWYDDRLTTRRTKRTKDRNKTRLITNKKIRASLKEDLRTEINQERRGSHEHQIYDNIKENRG